MSQYFIHDGNEQKGPFTIEYLKENKIPGDLIVWKEGMEGWQKAKDVEELKEVIISTPPPIPQAPQPVYSAEKNTVVKKSKSKRIALVAVLIIVVAVAGFIYYKQYVENKDSDSYGNSDYGDVSNSSDNEETIKEDLITIEKRNPKRYLSVESRARKNLIDQNVIIGTITNSATLAKYKDVVLKVIYLSQTGSELGTERFTVYEYVPSGGSIDFKVKLPETSRSVQQYQLEVISAKSAN